MVGGGTPPTACAAPVRVLTNRRHLYIHHLQTIHFQYLGVYTAFVAPKSREF